MSCIIAVLLLSLLWICSTRANNKADCDPLDPALSLILLDSPYSSHPYIEASCTKHINLWSGSIFYVLGSFVHQEHLGSVYANITYTCYDSTNHVIDADYEDDRDRNAPNVMRSGLPSDLSMKCVLSGCVELRNGSTYSLGSASCYIDFDECQSSESHNCTEIETCINDKEGTYDCIVPPRILEISDDLHILNYSSVNLNCLGSSLVGNVNITWTTSIPGLSLPQPTEITLDENTLSSSITLDSVDSSFDGKYICIVTNEFGSVNRSVTLTVIPILVVNTVTATTGTNTSLLCTNTTESGMEYAWEIDLNNDTRARIRGILTNELTILNVGVTDTKKYVCNVLLSGEIVGASISYLEVNGPQIVKHPENATLTSPLTFMLNCSVTNDNAVADGFSFHWLKNGEFLESPATSTIKLGERELVNQLQLTYNSSTTQRDMYQCIVTNRELEDGTKSLMAFITIHYNACNSDGSNDCDRNARCIYDGNGGYSCQCKDGYIESGKHCSAPPRITVFEVPESIDSGSNSTLMCVASGIPLPQITWFREGNPLRTSNHVTISTNASTDEVQSIVQLLSLTEEDSGEYECQASSSNYVVTKSTYMYVESIGLHGQSLQAVIGSSIVGILIMCGMAVTLLGIILCLFVKKQRKAHSKCTDNKIQIADGSIVQQKNMEHC